MKLKVLECRSLICSFTARALCRGNKPRGLRRCGETKSQQPTFFQALGVYVKNVIMSLTMLKSGFQVLLSLELFKNLLLVIVY